jgi:hypothetical protein
MNKQMAVDMHPNKIILLPCELCGQDRLQDAMCMVSCLLHHDHAIQLIIGPRIGPPLPHKGDSALLFSLVSTLLFSIFG